MTHVTVSFDKNAVKAKIKAAEGKALFITTEQALEDCNIYCKQDQGTLIASSQTASKPEKGQLIWDTPYARKQYYLKPASKVPNPQAEWMWAHKAHTEHGKDWKGTYEKAFKGGMEP